MIKSTLISSQKFPVFEILAKKSIFNKKCRIITLNGMTRVIKRLLNGTVKCDTHFLYYE
jgi:hypothetical protein